MNSQPTTVFIVDDHPFVREWLANLLRLEPDLKVVGQSDDPVAALSELTARPTDIAIVLVVHERPGVTSAATGGITSTSGPWHRVTSRLMFFQSATFSAVWPMAM